MTLAVACNDAFIWVIFFYLCLPLPWSQAPCGKHRVQLIPLCNPSSYLVQVQPLCQEDPLEKEMQLIPVFFPGKSHGQKSFVGYSPELQSMGSQRVRTTE